MSRYWTILPNGWLGTPYAADYYGQVRVWAPGLNAAYCGRHRSVDIHRPDTYQAWERCDCGLYCFGHDRHIERTPYYHLADGTFFHYCYGHEEERPDGVIGGIAYWSQLGRRGWGDDHTVGESIMRAQYAAITSFVCPTKAKRTKRRQLTQLAQQYEVPLVAADELVDAIDQWVAAARENNQITDAAATAVV